MTDLNRGPLASEATALPTEPQPLPRIDKSFLLPRALWNGTKLPRS